MDLANMTIREIKKAEIFQHPNTPYMTEPVALACCGVRLEKGFFMAYIGLKKREGVKALCPAGCGMEVNVSSTFEDVKLARALEILDIKNNSEDDELGEIVVNSDDLEFVTKVLQEAFNRERIDDCRKNPESLVEAALYVAQNTAEFYEENYGCYSTELKKR